MAYYNPQSVFILCIDIKSRFFGPVFQGFVILKFSKFVASSFAPVFYFLVELSITKTF